VSPEILPPLLGLFRNFGSLRLNRSMIGYTVENTTEPLKAEEFEAFARATRDRSYQDRTKFTEAPPLFLAKLILPMLKSVCFHPDLGLNLLRMVHSGQGLRRHRGIYAGDVLTLRLSIHAIDETPAGDKISLLGQAYQNDRLAVEGMTELIVRTRHRRTPRSDAPPQNAG
jgi:hypothetical protein